MPSNPSIKLLWRDITRPLGNLGIDDGAYGVIIDLHFVKRDFCRHIHRNR